ncbi:MAG: sigma 54-interacting transcriptional regulator [Rhodocyclales bacterium]|nr:sigma 54-interacting transcriptional regulator [Rhodocyclales bacterium]
MKSTRDLARDTEGVRRMAMQSMYGFLDEICEGALVVDTEARVVWMSEKYAAKLGLKGAAEALGRDVEQVIPSSLMREVLRTGKPILLDIMQIGSESFVVTRIPIRNEAGEVIGAIGFALYDQLHYLKPLFTKFSRLETALASAEKKLAEERRAKYTFSSFVGVSPACVEVKRQARRAAQLDAPVLLLGETGTGKELLAHAIHASGPRAKRPFVSVNVAAIPDTLLEAEFFGAAPGAYTGADRRGREGKFKLADGGTLFLDEIGDMPLPMQVKLLRVLQEREFEPLGSDKVVKTDVRIIAATSIDLEQRVAAGGFRADLYYRLNVLALKVPALRERLADLDILCEAILEQIARRSGAAVREISPDALDLLRSHDWPGNVRELSNVLERAAMMCDDVRLGVDDFLPILQPPADSAAAVEPPCRYDDALEAFERRVIRDALASTGGKVSQAAKLLGLGRATLYKKLVALGIATK